MLHAVYVTLAVIGLVMLGSISLNAHWIRVAAEALSETTREALAWMKRGVAGRKTPMGFDPMRARDSEARAAEESDDAPS